MGQVESVKGHKSIIIFKGENFRESMVRKGDIKVKKHEDPLEKGMATHSSILAWKIPWHATVHGVAKSWT